MREKLIELVRDMRRKITAWHTTEDIADMLIANDVIPVVRCKDCQYCDVYQTEAGAGSILICMIHSFEVVDSNGFCSRGERKDNETV